MKGLIIKDFLLFKSQKMFLIIVILVAGGLLVTGMDTIYICTYLTFMLSNLALSTISYDEYENGASYLFSLPVTRTGYVREKYVFFLLNCIGSWLIFALLGLGYMTVSHQPIDAGMFWLGNVTGLLCSMVYGEITIPMWMKLGPEKGRLTFFVMAAGLCVPAILSQKIFNAAGNPEELSFLLDYLSEKPTVVMLVFGAAVLFGLVISYRISLEITRKKEL